MNKILLILTEIISRAIFVVHGFISIVLLFCFHTDDHLAYWLLFIPQIGLLSEFVLTMWKRKSMQFRFFWPSGFFYVLTMIPIIWINELELNNVVDHDDLRLDDENIDVGLINTTRKVMTPKSFKPPPVYKLGKNGSICYKVSMHLYVKQICELGMFLCLIIGRWMIPRGQITRDQLSALLLGFVGTTADILEIFELFKEDGIRDNHGIIITVILMFTLATFQFTLVTTATSDDSESFKDIFKHKKSNNMVSPIDEEANSMSPSTRANDEEKQTYIERIQKQKSNKKMKQRAKRGKGKKNLPKMAQKIADAEAARKAKLKEEKRQMHTELFQIMVTLVMQDAPFLILRVYIIMYYKIFSEMHIFFTCKNILVVLLLVYRILILNCEGVDKDDDWRDENMKIKIQHIHFPSLDNLGSDSLQGSTIKSKTLT